MFSLPKLVILALILWGVWVLFKILGRGKISGSDGFQYKQKGRPNESDSVDVRECLKCGTYSGPAGCQQPDCPLRS